MVYLLLLSVFFLFFRIKRSIRHLNTNFTYPAIWGNFLIWYHTHFPMQTILQVYRLRAVKFPLVASDLFPLFFLPIDWVVYNCYQTLYLLYEQLRHLSPLKLHEGQNRFLLFYPLLSVLCHCRCFFIVETSRSWLETFLYFRSKKNFLLCLKPSFERSVHFVEC